MGELNFIRTLSGRNEIGNVLEAFDLNVKSPILLAIGEIEEKADHKLCDAVATIRAALNVWEHIEQEAREKFRQQNEG